MHNIREYCLRGEHPLDFEYVRNDDRHKLMVSGGLMGNGTIIDLFSVDKVSMRRII